MFVATKFSRILLMLRDTTVMLCVFLFSGKDELLKIEVPFFQRLVSFALIAEWTCQHQVFRPISTAFKCNCYHMINFIRVIQFCITPMTQSLLFLIHVLYIFNSIETLKTFYPHFAITRISISFQFAMFRLSVAPFVSLKLFWISKSSLFFLLSTPLSIGFKPPFFILGISRFLRLSSYITIILRALFSAALLAIFIQMIFFARSIVEKVLCCWENLLTSRASFETFWYRNILTMRQVRGYFSSGLLATRFALISQSITHLFCRSKKLLCGWFGFATPITSLLRYNITHEKNQPFFSSCSGLFAVAPEQQIIIPQIYHKSA